MLLTRMCSLTQADAGPECALSLSLSHVPARRLGGNSQQKKKRTLYSDYSRALTFEKL
jgi:hypothetical protein